MVNQISHRKRTKRYIYHFVHLTIYNINCRWYIYLLQCKRLLYFFIDTMKLSPDSQQKIRKYFNKLSKKIFLKKDLDQIINMNYQLWELPSYDIDNYIDCLKKIELREIILSSPNYDKKFTRFAWGEKAHVYELSLSIKPRSYFSHQTAMYLHGLTDKIPETIYVNSEQSPKQYRESSLEQERIDAAFKRKPRTSKFIFTYKKWMICLLNGINTDNLGVIEKKVPEEGKLSLTNIERTLIDIAVRPVYSGGCKDVVEAYERARNNVSVDRLVKMLKKINYIYPYCQAIGFYMQRAGFDVSDLDKLRKFDNMKYDFYLDYDMKNTAYSEEWKLYYSKRL